MSPVRSTAEVFEAIQRVKSGATAFSTNFFPVEARLQSWIEHNELFSAQAASENVAFFFRKDRAFFHLYFCAPSPTALSAACQSVTAIRGEGLSADVLSQQAATAELVAPLQQSGFRKYSQLVRLARVRNTADNPTQGPAPASSSTAVELALETDGPRIVELLEASFDRFADQLPFDYEIRAAIANQQIFVIRQESAVAAFLHFETHGFTSTLRFWVVGQPVRASGFGSTLVRHYFASQTTVRRFILWVNAANENALQKYRHYGYAPDGLVDHILVNSLIL
jgi:hypothetical protein